MNNYIYIPCIYLLLLLTGVAHAQSRFEGQVMDHEKKPLPQVTVSSKVSGRSTVTDKEGFFTIQLLLPDTLRFSLIGYESLYYPITESIDQRMVIALSNTGQEIEEVVVNTGYQRLKPNEINGSVTVIDSETLNLQNGINILQRLDGVTNGLSFNIGKRNTNPQNNTNIMVRGHSTINGPLDPLIVLDNFVYEGDIDNINPDDVESVTILKDAAATSIYGARGGNGVIVITTKQGKFGQPIRVDLRMSTMIEDIPDLSPLRGMDNRDYIEVEHMLYERGGFNADINGILRPALTPVADVLYRRDQGLLTAQETEDRIGQYERSDFLKDYSQAFYRKGATQQYSIGLRGGTEKHNWLFSGSLNNVTDNTANRLDRGNLRLSNTVKVSKWMSLGIDAQVNQRNGRSGVVPPIEELRRYGSRSTVPYVMLYDEAGEALPVHNKYNTVYLDTVGKGRLLDWKYYPVQERDLQETKSKSQELLGNIHADITPFRGFRLFGAYQYQRQSVDTRVFHDRDSYMMRDMVNRFAQINETTGVVTYPVPHGDRLILQDKSISSQQFRLQSSYNEGWDLHKVNGILGFEAREVKTYGDNAWIYGYNQDPLSRIAVNHTTAFPQRPAGVSMITGGAWPDADIVRRFVSLYGNVYYSFKDRYSLTGSFRKDGSNIYGVTTNDKWKPLWSIGIGYEISKEPFFRQGFVEYLKLRSTLGYSGNVDLSRSALPIAGFSNGEAALGSLPTARIGTLNNPSLRWEEVRHINYGIDFRAWHNRLSGSFEYYVKKSTDLYGPSYFDYTTWGVNPTIVMNAADLSGKGMDVQLRIVPVQRKLTWQSSFIFNYNTSKVEKYHVEANQSRSQLDMILELDGDYIIPIEGRPLYNIAAYRWGGLDEHGDPVGYLHGELSKEYTDIILDVRENGDVNGSARFVGTTVPVYFGSWLNEVSYRDISLSWNITYRTGYYFRRQTIHYGALVDRGGGHPDFALRWQKPGDETITDVPAFIFPTIVNGRDALYRNGEQLIERADHVRLQFINLSYNVQADRRYLPKSMRFFVNVANLGILWRANRHGLDPDYPYAIRPSRTVSLGLSTIF